MNRKINKNTTLAKSVGPDKLSSGLLTLSDLRAPQKVDENSDKKKKR
jgi:hypothetical protein